MSEPTKDEQISKLSVKNGIMIGVISVVLSTVLFLIDPLMQFSSTLAPILIGVFILALVIILAIDTRKKIGGYWTFGQAYKYLIINALFICLFSVLYNFIIFKFVDPSLPGKIKDVTVERMTAMFEKMGLDQTKVDKATEQFNNGDFEARLQPTFKNELTNLGVGLLFYAIIHLIVAAIIKKNPPLFDVIDPEATDPTV